MEHCAHSRHFGRFLLVRCGIAGADTSYIVIAKRELTVANAFTSISLFTMLRAPLNVLPTFVGTALVALTADCLLVAGGSLRQAYRGFPERGRG